MTFTELIYGILFQPSSTLRYLGEEKPLGKAILVFIIVLLFNAIIGQETHIIDPTETAQLVPREMMWVFNFIIGIMSFVMLFLMAGLFSLLGDIIYSRENAKGLLACLAFATVPGVLGPPLQYLAFAAGMVWLGLVISLGIAMWLIVLQVISIREGLLVDTGQAVVIFIIPLIALTVIMVATVIAVAASVPLTDISW